MQMAEFTGSDPHTSPAQPMGLGTDVAIIANCRAGHGDPVSALLEQAADAVHAAGGRVVNDPCGGSIRGQLDYSGDPPRLVMAIGGDGTVNAAARLAVRTDAALLILPHGTMNLVARDLHLPADPEAILHAATEFSFLHIDYATANGQLFLHSALIGLVPQMTVIRERIREAEGLLATARHLPAFLLSAFRSSPLELRFESRGRASRRRSRSVAITTNPLSEEGAISYARASVAGGRLGIYTSAHNGLLAPFKLLLSLGTGRLSSDPQTLAASGETLQIHAGRRAIAVSLDGEIVEMKSPLEFVIHPRGLRVALPAAMFGAVSP